MAPLPALWFQGGGGVPTYDPVDDRTFVAAALAGNMFDTVTAGQGIRGRGHGVLAGDAFAVSATGTNDKSVRIGPGFVSIRGAGTNQLGCYIAGNDANDDTVILDNRPTVTNSRRDLIIARLRDNAYGITGDDWIVDKLTGTPGTSPTDPTVPSGSAIVVLARVTIPPGANPFTVTAGMLTDLRPHARAVGGIQPIGVTADHPSPEEYDFVWDSGGVLRAYLTGGWRDITRDLDTNWTSVTTPDWDGTFTLGNGSHYLRWFRQGRTIRGVAGFVRGSTSGGTGALRLDLVGSGLPAVMNTGTAGGLYLADGRAYSVLVDGHYTSVGEIDHTDSRIKNFATGGFTVWNQATVGTPFPLVAWATGDHFRIRFKYEAA
jgi:hypothetical protein